MTRIVRRGFALASAMALIVSVFAVTGTVAKATCQVINDAAPAVSFGTLQSAVDAASARDTLRVTGTCVGNTTILKLLTIAGAPRATLSGNDAGPVLTIRNETTFNFDPVTLVGLTIAHGRATSTSGGGGINNSFSGLTLVDSTVTDNAGGGIVSDHSRVILQDSAIRNNTVVGIGVNTTELYLFGASSVDHNSGSGISNGDSSTRLFDTSSVHHNSTGGDGGGIYNVFGRVVLNDDSSVDHNTTGGDGGGVFNDFVGSLTLNGRSSISHNRAGGDGGGVNTQRGTTVTLLDASSISHNSAGGDGGGIWGSNQLGSLVNCVAGVNVVHNHPDDIFLEP
jgi:hypothetical protein